MLVDAMEEVDAVEIRLLEALSPDGVGESACIKLDMRLLIRCVFGPGLEGSNRDSRFRLLSLSSVFVEGVLLDSLLLSRPRGG